jgi:hypothetical protein
MKEEQPPVEEWLRHEDQDTVEKARTDVGEIEIQEVTFKEFDERLHRFTVEYGERVVQFAVKGPQKLMKLRRKIIRTFRLKRMKWCLEAFMYPGGGKCEWVPAVSAQNCLKGSRHKVTML